jgi:hypothetical protein
MANSLAVILCPTVPLSHCPASPLPRRPLLARDLPRPFLSLSGELYAGLA